MTYRCRRTRCFIENLVYSMYKVKKRIVISAAHYLKLDYESKCTNLHGHNWIIDVYLKSDHKVINDVIDVNPTAENIAFWVCEQLQPYCYRVDVEESPQNSASYEKDDTAE